MWFHSLMASWKSARSHSRRPQPRPACRGIRLTVERLEDRSLPSSYSAASVSALIADISAANTAGGTNTITLTAPTTSPYVLTGVNNSTYGNTGLPVVADNLTILGNGDTIERSTASGTADFRLFAMYAADASLTLADMTLQNGEISSQTYGGGAIYNDYGVLTLSGVTVQNNSDYAPEDVQTLGGGAIYSGGSLTMDNGTVLEGNVADTYYARGGAVFISRTSVALESQANITDTTFTGNTAKGEGAWGGALAVVDASVVLTNTTLTNNNADGAYTAGGGLCVGGVVGGESLGGEATLSNCTVQSNSAGDGGGLYVLGQATLSSCALESNSAVSGGGVYVGEGIGFDQGGAGTVTLSSCALESNTAKYGGGLYVAAEGTATLSSCTVESNSAANAGGGLYIYTEGTAALSGTATLSSCTVQSNSAPYGGGLYVLGGTVTLSNSTVESNSATDYGGGIYIASAAAVSIDPFTVASTINNTDSSGSNGSTANIDGTYIVT